MNIIITGSNGFLAKKLISNISKKKNFIIGIDKKLNDIKIKKNFKFIKCDITNNKKLLKEIKKIKLKIDLVIHMAALQPLSQKQDLFKMNSVNSFHLGIYGHYKKKGYELVANEILNQIKK